MTEVTESASLMMSVSWDQFLQQTTAAEYELLSHLSEPEQRAILKQVLVEFQDYLDNDDVMADMIDGYLATHQIEEDEYDDDDWVTFDWLW